MRGATRRTRARAPKSQPRNAPRKLPSAPLSSRRGFPLGAPPRLLRSHEMSIPTRRNSCARERRWRALGGVRLERHAVDRAVVLARAPAGGGAARQPHGCDHRGDDGQHGHDEHPGAERVGHRVGTLRGRESRDARDDGDRDEATGARRSRCSHRSPCSRGRRRRCPSRRRSAAPRTPRGRGRTAARRAARRRPSRRLDRPVRAAASRPPAAAGRGRVGAGGRSLVARAPDFADPINMRKVAGISALPAAIADHPAVTWSWYTSRKNCAPMVA